MCSHQYEVEVVSDSKSDFTSDSKFDSKTMTKEPVMNRIRAMFHAKPVVANVVVYYTGPGDKDGGWEINSGAVISIGDLLKEWLFSAAQKAGAQLTIVCDSCYSGAMVQNAANLFRGAGLLVGAVSVQASVAATHRSYDGVFARRWIEFVSGVKSQTGVLQELTKFGELPSAFSSRPLPTNAPFQLIGATLVT
jgi:hypothetical protein